VRPDNIINLKIAIFCTRRSSKVLEAAIDYYLSIGLKSFEIICPKKDFKNLNLFKNNIDFTFDEDLPFYEELFETSKNLKKKQGWYLQQFLKLSYWYRSTNDCLVVDGDTIISKETLQNVIYNNCLYYTKENVSNYNFITSNLLKGVSSNKSFICNFANFKRENKYLFADGFMNFIKNISILLEKNSDEDFSEYQLHGTIESKKNENQKKLIIFRRADLFIWGPLKLSKKFDSTNLDDFFFHYGAICYESNHKKNIFMSLLAHFYKFIGISW
tara:strand:- start:2456 stop:3271 length:816 start_codon:yes stop_codon:yes gene_type:complete